MLQIDAKAQFSDIVTDFEWRTHTPFTSTAFNPDDEVRIAIQQQDYITLPYESSIHITGSLYKSDGKTKDSTLGLVNYAMTHLISEIRYEIGGITVDRTKNVGITSLLHTLVALTPADESILQNACWNGVGKVAMDIQEFSFCVPLKLLMGFFEDYRRVIVNQKQELIIILAPNRKDAVYKKDANDAFTDYKLTIDRISWRVPYIKVTETVKMPLLQMLKDDTVLEMPFRTWQLYDYPNLPKTDRHSWAIKTASQLEKPRYVIIAFQTGRKNNVARDSSEFDMCSLTNVRLYLNSNYYPYDYLKGDKALMYDMYSRFQSSYYNKDSRPIMSRSVFDKNPVFVIDCSKQNESLKSGPVDVRLDFETSVPFPDNTTAYCLIIHDAVVECSPHAGIVKRLEY